MRPRAALRRSGPTTRVLPRPALARRQDLPPTRRGRTRRRTRRRARGAAGDIPTAGSAWPASPGRWPANSAPHRCHRRRPRRRPAPHRHAEQAAAANERHRPPRRTPPRPNAPAPPPSRNASRSPSVTVPSPGRRSATSRSPATMPRSRRWAASGRRSRPCPALPKPPQPPPSGPGRRSATPSGVEAQVRELQKQQDTAHAAIRTCDRLTAAERRAETAGGHQAGTQRPNKPKPPPDRRTRRRARPRRARRHRLRRPRPSATRPRRVSRLTSEVEQLRHHLAQPKPQPQPPTNSTNGRRCTGTAHRCLADRQPRRRTTPPEVR